MPQDWKESYHALRAQHSELQRRYHERTEELKRTNVQLSKIENLMRTKERLDSSGGSGLSRAAKTESETMIQGLYEDKSRVEARARESGRKAKELQEANDRLKREVAVAKRAARGKTATFGGASLRTRDDGFLLTTKGADSQKLAELVSRFKRRVEEAEAELEKLRHENKALRGASRNGSSPRHQSSSSSPSKSGSRFFGGGNGSLHVESVELNGSLKKADLMDRELRDAKAELQLVKMRYDHLEVKCKATTELQKGSFDQLDEYNRRIRELRRALQDAQHDKEAAETRAARCSEFEDRVTELQATNRHLEDQITKLCESPFISEAYEKQDRMTRLASLERDGKTSKQKIGQLKEAAQGAEDRIRKLQQALDQLRAEKDLAEHKAAELGLKFRETNAGNELLHDKMRLYIGEDAGVDMEELERALTMVKRRHATELPENHLDFLLPVGGGDGGDGDYGTLKKKFEAMRERHLELQCECERSEKMLKVQMSINRDLHLEVEEAQGKQSVEKRDLVVKCEDYEALNVRRLQRINVLEAQVRQLRYSVASGGRKGRHHAPAGLGGGDDVSEAGSESTRGLLAELGSGELEADENLVEVWIVEAELFDGVVAPGGSSFAVVDFFNFESQATQWLAGTKPEFDFATSYKVKVDDLFLRYLATEAITIEVCEAQQADYELVCSASIPLAPLLDSKPTLVVHKCALRQARTGRHCGFVHVELRLALPVTELYQLFLDRHPAERVAIERAMVAALTGADPTAAGDDADRLGHHLEGQQDAALANEIEIVVHSAAGLPARFEDSEAPAAYVHYQLLQFADAFTPVHEGSRDPTFEHVLAYPLASTAQALSILRTERLEFTVLDFRGDASGDDDALVGTCDLSLAALAEGEAVFSTVPLVSETGRDVGTLRVAARWRHPFRDARSAALGPSALSDVEVSWILAEFSPHKDGQVDYAAFLHDVDASPAVTSAVQKLRSFVERAKLAQGVAGAAELLGPTFEKEDLEDMSEDDFATALLKLHAGVPADELCALLRHARRKQPRFRLEDLVRLAEKPQPVEAATLYKLRAHAKQLRRQGRALAEPFEDLDPGRTGRLPRPTFKSALVTMGFSLPDEPDHPAPRHRPVDTAHEVSDYYLLHEDDVAAAAADEYGREETALRDSQRAFDDRVRAARREKDLLLKDAHGGRRTSIMDTLDEGELIIGGDDDDAAAAAGQNKNKPDIPVVRTSSKAHNDDDDRGAVYDQSVVAAAGKEKKKPREGLLRDEDEAALRAMDVRGRGDAPAVSAKATRRSVASVVAADKAIRAMIQRLEGRREVPDLRPTFKPLDPTKSKSVSRAQFAWAMQKHAQEVELTPDELEALMAHFSVAAGAPLADDAAVNYPAFIKFFEHRPCAPSPAARLAKRLALTDGVVRLFEESDPGRAGAMGPDAFARCLRSVGHNVDPDELRCCARLFPPARLVVARASLDDGGASAGAQIDYRAFLAYAMEQDASLGLRAAGNRVRDSAQRAMEGPRGPDAVRAVFRSCDSRGRARLDRRDFERVVATLLDEDDVERARGALDTAELNAYVSQLDPTGDGVSYDAFLHAIQMVPLPLSAVLAPGDVDWAHARCRAHAALLEATERLGNRTTHQGDGAAKAQAEAEFGHFDWRGASVVSVDAFVVAALRSGFLFSRAELRALGERFLVTDRGAAYGRFLAWATTTDQRSGSSAAAASSSSSSSKRRDALLRKVARSVRKTRRWAAVFDDLDRGASGKVSARDFGLALLDELRCDLEDTDIAVLVEAYGDHGKMKLVSYRDFVEDVERAASDKSPLTTTNKNKKKNNDGHQSSTEENNNSLEHLASNDATAALRDALKECVREGVDYRAVFEEKDPDFSGVLSRADLEHALGKIRVSAAHADALEAKFRASAKGGVQYVELLNSVLPPTRRKGASGNNNNNNNNVEAWRVEERLRSMIRRRFEWKLPGRLRRAFRHFDTNRGGRVTEAELSDGLRALKIKLSAEQDRGLFEALDLDRDGLIDYPEFVVFVRDPYHHFVEQKVKYAVAATSMSAAAARATLEDFDSNKSGLIGLRDFGVALQRLSIDLTASEKQRLALRFDVNEDGNVSIERFFAFLKGEREGGLNRTSESAGLRALRTAILRDITPSSSYKGKTTLKKVDLMRHLKTYDRDGAGALEKADFTEALEVLGFDLSTGDLALVLEHFDRTGDGTVTIRDFVKFIESKDADAADAGVEQTVKRELARLGELAGEAVDLTRLFVDLDPRDTGSVSQRDFRRELDRAGLDLTSSELDALSRRFDREGLVHYAAFVKFASGLVEPPGIVLLRKELKHLARKKQRDGADAPDYGRIFRKFDRDDSGKLERREFRKALDDLGFDTEEISSDILTSIMEFFDNDGDGSISIVEFVKFCEGGAGGDGGGDSQRAASALEQLITREIRRLARGRSSKGRLAEAFSEFDRNDSGYVSKREFARELERLGFDFSAEELDEVVFKKFDKDGDGKIAFGEFLKMVRSGAGADDDGLLGKFRPIFLQAAEDGVRIRDCFRRYDRDDTGDLDELDFEKGLKKAGVDAVSTRDVGELMERFASTRSGRIRYDDFIRAALAKKNLSSSRLDRDGLDPLRDEVKRLAKSRHGSPDYGRVFKELDRSGRGELSRRDLRRGLERLGFDNLRSDDFEAIFDRFDRNNDGVVSIREFVDFAKEGDGAAGVVATIRREVRRLKHRRGSKAIRTAFEDFDLNGSGSISRREFRTVLEDHIGFVVSADELDDLFARFDRDGDGAITYKEFVRIAEAPDDDDNDDVDDAIVNDVILKLRIAVRRAERDDLNPTLAATFEKLDRAGAGDLDEFDVERAFRKLGVNLNAADLAYLKDRHGARGRIRYPSLLKDIRAGTVGDDDDDDTASRRSRRLRTASSRSPRGHRRSSRSPRMLLTDGEEEEEDAAVSSPSASSMGMRVLRRELRRVARSSRHGAAKPDYADLFRRLDRDGSGYLERREVRKACDACGFDELSSADLTHVVEHFDRSGQGRVSIRDFVAFLEDHADEALEKLRRMVQVAVDRDGISIHECFKHFDRDGSGDIDEAEFERGLKKLGIVDLPHREARKLAQDFAGRSGTIRYKDFIRAVAPSMGGASSPTRLRGSASPTRRAASGGQHHYHHHLLEAVERLEHDMRRAAKKGKFIDLKATLKDHDRDGSGALDRRQLRRALEAAGLDDISSADLTQIIQNFDKHDDGRVPIRDLLRFADDATSGVSSSSSTNALAASFEAVGVGGALVEDILDQLRSMVRDALRDGISVHECFEHFDRDGSGDLDDDEFKAGLKKLGIRLSSREVRKIIDHFPSRHAGRIKYRDFARAVAETSRSPKKSSSRSHAF